MSERQPDDTRQKMMLWEYVKSGPQASPTLGGRVIAFWLWWKTWLLLAVIFGSWVALAYVSVWSGPKEVYGYGVGILTMMLLNQIEMGESDD